MAAAQRERPSSSSPQSGLAGRGPLAWERWHWIDSEIEHFWLVLPIALQHFLAFHLAGSWHRDPSDFRHEARQRRSRSLRLFASWPPCRPKVSKAKLVQDNPASHLVSSRQVYPGLSRSQFHRLRM